MYHFEDGEEIDFYDFFEDNELLFYQKEFPEAKCVYGGYHNPIPLVTIIITTYKRPRLLRYAIDSALNQKGFSDYQLLIVDNECVPIEEETETSLLVTGYHSDKIIYYRNITPAASRMDNGVRLSKSKWIVFLHDDDQMSPISLKILTCLAKNNNKIKFLSVPTMDIHGLERFNSKYDENSIDCSVICYHQSQLKRNYMTGWLGALIERESYISSGGMPMLSMGFGDYIMVQKFHYKYGIYEVRSPIALYYYRKSTAQVSSNQLWAPFRINEYYYRDYVIDKIDSKKKFFWKLVNIYITINECIFDREEYGQNNIDSVLQGCKIDKKRYGLVFMKFMSFFLIVYRFYEEMFKRKTVMRERILFDGQIEG